MGALSIHGQVLEHVQHTSKCGHRQRNNLYGVVDLEHWNEGRQNKTGILVHSAVIGY